MVNIKLLFIIMDEGYDKKVNYLLSRLGIKVKTVSIAKGTASPSVLDYFGLVETKKNVFMTIIPEYLTETAFTKLKNTFHLDQRGTGIAFTVPISSSNKFLSDVFYKNNDEGSKEIMRETKTIQYHLIITIVSEGYLENVMTAAKRVGCGGGTVLKGRELANIIPKKVLGFNIQPEKEIIINIVQDKDKKSVMEEISKVVGIKTKAKGICMSLPVEDVLGLEVLD